MKNNTPFSLSLQKEISNLENTQFASAFNDALISIKARSLLRVCGIAKQKGFATITILYAMLLLPFVKGAVRCMWSSDFFLRIITAQKDAYYRFLNNERFNWRRFVYLFCLRILNNFDEKPLSDKVLIADDTITEKTGKNIDLASYHFDHAKKRSILGHQWLQLAYQVGTTLFPIDMTVHVSEHRSNEIERDIDKRTSGYKRRTEGFLKKTDALVAMLKRAYDKGIDAAFVLFDSWFAHDAVIAQIIEVGYNVICRLKRGKAKYGYQGKKLTLTQIWVLVQRQAVCLHNKDIRGIKVRASLDKTGPVSIVFVTSKDGKAWHAFLCTDTDLQLDAVLEYYARRWAIEVFFKDAKQLLHLGKEQSETFEALIASYSLVMIRYLLLVHIINSYKLTASVAPLFHQCAEVQLEMFFAMRIWGKIKDLMLLSSDLVCAEINTEIFIELINFIENIISEQLTDAAAKL